MPILPEYTSRIHTREERVKDYKFMYPYSDESEDEIRQMLIAEEQEYLAAEIPPYIDDLYARLGGQALTHPELLTGSVGLRNGEPTNYLLFRDTDGTHRIIVHAVQPSPGSQTDVTPSQSNVVTLESARDRTQREVYALGRQKIITSETTNELVESWRHLFASSDTRKVELAFEVLSNAVDNGDAPHWLLEILYEAYLSDTPPGL